MIISAVRRENLIALLATIRGIDQTAHAHRLNSAVCIHSLESIKTKLAPCKVSQFYLAFVA